MGTVLSGGRVNAHFYGRTQNFKIERTCPTPTGPGAHPHGLPYMFTSDGARKTPASPCQATPVPDWAATSFLAGMRSVRSIPSYWVTASLWRSFLRRKFATEHETWKSITGRSRRRRSRARKSEGMLSRLREMNGTPGVSAPIDRSYLVPFGGRIGIIGRRLILIWSCCFVQVERRDVAFGGKTLDLNGR